jgi:hypothetical protein
MKEIIDWLIDYLFIYLMIGLIGRAFGNGRLPNVRFRPELRQRNFEAK